MARNNELIQKRNIEIEKHYNKICKKYPHYKHDYILQMVADKFFLSPRTVYGIISGETTKKQNNKIPS